MDWQNPFWVAATVFGFITLVLEFTSYQMKDRRRYLIAWTLGNFTWIFMFLFMTLDGELQIIPMINAFLGVARGTSWLLIGSKTQNRRKWMKIVTMLSLGIGVGGIILSFVTQPQFILVQIPLVIFAGYFTFAQIMDAYNLRLSIVLYALSVILLNSPLRLGYDEYGAANWFWMGIILEVTKITSALIFMIIHYKKMKNPELRAEYLESVVTWRQIINRIKIIFGAKKKVAQGGDVETASVDAREDVDIRENAVKADNALDGDIQNNADSGAFCQFDKRTKEIDCDVSMYDFIMQRQCSPSKNILGYFGSNTTWGDLTDRIDRLAHYFSKTLGLKKGDCAAICLPNMTEGAAAFYAMNKLGIIANMLSPLLAPHALKKSLKETDSKLIFVADVLFNKYNGAFDDLDIPIVVCNMGEYASPLMQLGIWFMKKQNKIPSVKYGKNILKFASLLEKSGKTDSVASGQDIAVYLHGGGTTAESKTIVLSNKAINSMTDNVAHEFSKFAVLDDVVTLMVLPLFHGYGLTVNMHTPLWAKAKIIMIPKLEPKAAIKIIKKERVSALGGVPKMYERLFNEPSFKTLDCSNFKMLTFGADSMSPALRNSIDEALKNQGAKCRLTTGYGLTETVNVVSANPFEFDAEFDPNSHGKPFKDVEFKIVDQDNNILEAGELGEIHVHCPYIMEGYLNDPEATERVIYVDEHGKKWVRTNDVGHLDSDGVLYFKERMSRVMKISGHKVYPTEIEKLINVMDEIKVCCIVPESMNEKTIVKLIAVLEDGVQMDEALQEKIKKECFDKLTVYSIPKKFEVRDELPMTMAGKVFYRQIIEENKT